MGRHSIPDPEESSGGPPEGASRRDRVVRSSRWSRRTTSRATGGPAEPELPGARRVPSTGSRSTETEFDTGLRRRVRGRVSRRRDYPSAEHSDVPEYLQPGYREPELRRGRVRPSAAEPPSYAARTPTAKPPPRAQHSGRLGGRRMDRQPPRHPDRAPRRQHRRHRRAGRGRRCGGRLHPVALLRRRAVRPVQRRFRAVRRRPESRRRHRRPGHRRRDLARWPRSSTRPPTRSATAVSRWTSNPPNPTR